MVYDLVIEVAFSAITFLGLSRPYMGYLEGGLWQLMYRQVSHTIASEYI
jgi:hypothetical protein